MLTKEQILSANDLKTQEVPIPEWGDSVCIREMSGAEKDGWDAELQKASESKSFENVRAKLLVRTVCDAQGNLLFTLDDVQSLGQKSTAALQRLFEAAVKLNAISKAEQDELVKN